MQIWADAGCALTFCNLQTTSSKVIYGQETERTQMLCYPNASDAMAKSASVWIELLNERLSLPYYISITCVLTSDCKFILCYKVFFFFWKIRLKCDTSGFQGLFNRPFLNHNCIALYARLKLHYKTKHLHFILRHEICKYRVTTCIYMHFMHIFL